MNAREIGGKSGNYVNPLWFIIMMILMMIMRYGYHLARACWHTSNYFSQPLDYHQSGVNIPYGSVQLVPGPTFLT